MPARTVEQVVLRREAPLQLPGIEFRIVLAAEDRGRVRTHHRHQFAFARHGRLTVPLERPAVHQFRLHPSFRPSERGQVLHQQFQDAPVFVARGRVRPADDQRIGAPHGHVQVEHQRPVGRAFLFPGHVMPRVGDAGRRQAEPRRLHELFQRGPNRGFAQVGALPLPRRHERPQQTPRRRRPFRDALVDVPAPRRCVIASRGEGELQIHGHGDCSPFMAPIVSAPRQRARKASFPAGCQGDGPSNHVYDTTRFAPWSLFGIVLGFLRRPRSRQS